MYIYTYTCAIYNTKGNEIINSENVQDIYVEKYASQRNQRSEHIIRHTELIV